MAHKGNFDLEYTDKDEERGFLRSRKLAGFHTSLVKQCYPPESYESIAGSAWTEAEPQGRGTKGVHGMALRYATIDPWYKEWAVENGKFSEQEVDIFRKTWQSRSLKDLPLNHQELLKIYRSNKLSPNRQVETRQRGRKTKNKSYERRFDAERNPATIFRQLKAGAVNLSALDEQVLKQVARSMANGNDMLYQAESMKDEDSIVPSDLMADYNKAIDLALKVQKQTLDLMKSHGYDFSTRKARREAQTAAEIFEDAQEKAAKLFDTRAIRLICKECSLDMGVFIRHFPTVEYRFATKCPRCDADIERAMEALADEVMDA
jgi:hypothetical protein